MFRLFLQLLSFAECSRDSAGAGSKLGVAVCQDSQPVASLRHGKAVVLNRVTASLPVLWGGLEGHQPGGVEQEGVQVLSMDGPME